MHKPDILEYWAKEAHQLGLEQGNEQGFEKGVEQGTRNQILESVLEVLEVQLSPEVAHQVKPQLQKINDLQHLRQLFRTALTAENAEAFHQALQAYSQNN